MTETCSNCRFHHTINGDQGVDYFCRLKPPHFLSAGSSVLLLVDANGWCGEYVPAPRSDPRTERSANLSVRTKPKKGVSAII